MCRRCGFARDASPYRDPVAIHNADQAQPSPVSTPDQGFELLQIGVVILAFFGAVIVASLLWLNHFGGTLSFASFFLVLVGVSVGGLVGLSAARRRFLGKGGGLVSVDKSETLNRFGLTSIETTTLAVVPGVIAALGFRFATPSFVKFLALLAGYGLIWGGAAIAGQYRLRSRSRQ